MDGWMDVYVCMYVKIYIYIYIYPDSVKCTLCEELGPSHMWVSDRLEYRASGVGFRVGGLLTRVSRCLSRVNANRAFWAV